MEKRNRLSKAKWIEIARKVFIEEGVEGVKMDKLAVRNGVSRGSLYWHFKNRTDLLRCLVDDWETGNTNPMIERISAVDGGPIDRFIELARIWIFEIDYQPGYDMAIRDWSRTDKEVRRVLRRVDKRRIKFFTELFLDTGCDEEEAFIRARILYFHQIGYYTSGQRENSKTRLQLGNTYLGILTGFTDFPPLNELFTKNGQIKDAK